MKHTFPKGDAKLVSSMLYCNFGNFCKTDEEMPSDLLLICYANDVSFLRLTPSRCEELLEKGMIWNDPTTDPVSEAEPTLMFFPFSFPPDPVFKFTPLLMFILRDQAPFVFQAFIRPGTWIT